MRPIRTPDLSWRRRAAKLAGVVAIGVVGLGLSGCSKKVAIAQVPPAPLEVPVVPPRLVGPVVVEEPAPTTAEVPEPAPARPRPPRPATRTGNEPVVRVEPPPPESSKPAEPTPNGTPASSGTNASAEPAPLLRTPDTADDEGVAKSVRETLTRAEQNLNKVPYQSLSPGAKAQHDTARRFIAQANDALKSRRLDFARYLADKADRLSASLLNK
jgi:hypothetical protein